jgi:hypothetical protein
VLAVCMLGSAQARLAELPDPATLLPVLYGSGRTCTESFLLDHARFVADQVGSLPLPSVFPDAALPRPVPASCCVTVSCGPPPPRDAAGPPQVGCL